MNRVHHAGHRAVKQVLSILGVQVADQLGRADDIGEQDGDLLALAFEARAMSQDLVGQAPSSYSLDRRHAEMSRYLSYTAARHCSD